jgi:hypothetical protein
MPAGRPIEFTDEYLAKAKAYLDLCTDKRVKIGKDIKMRVKLPSMGGLARYLNIARSTIYEWKEISPDFSDVCEQIVAEQEERLINNGLSGDYSPNLSKFILSARHEYREKSDVTTNGKDLPTPLLNAIQHNDSNEESSEPHEED